MNALDPRLRTWLVWALPFAAIALLIGWETDWGRALRRVPPLEEARPAQPVNVGLLPEYQVEGGVNGNRETVERTLFNPTRRPAPTLAVAAAKPTMVKGQFQLMGTTVVDQRATAFLKETNGGKSRRVAQGETVNGMLVSEVRPDRVRLTLNDDFEELTLKPAPGPKTTVQPVVAQPGQPGGPFPGQPGGPVAGQPGAGGAVQQARGAQVAPAQEVGDVLAARRRAARAAEAAAQQQQAAAQQQAAPAAPTTAAPQAAGQAGTADPAWNEVYRRYMQPRQ